LTYDLTLGWARVLARMNPAMTFVYVSGRGTGTKAMWAQVKARTEAALLALFPSAYMIRLSALRPMHGEVSKTRWTRIGYAVLRPVLPLMHAVAPSAVITTEELGRAMIRAARQGAPRRVLENRDLRALGSVLPPGWDVGTLGCWDVRMSQDLGMLGGRNVLTSQHPNRAGGRARRTLHATRHRRTAVFRQVDAFSGNHENASRRRRDGEDRHARRRRESPR